MATVPSSTKRSAHRTLKVSVPKLLNSMESGGFESPARRRSLFWVGSRAGIRADAGSVVEKEVRPAKSGELAAATALRTDFSAKLGSGLESGLAALRAEAEQADRVDRHSHAAQALHRKLKALCEASRQHRSVVLGLEAGLAIHLLYQHDQHLALERQRNLQCSAGANVTRALDANRRSSDDEDSTTSDEVIGGSGSNDSESDNEEFISGDRVINICINEDAAWAVVSEAEAMQAVALLCEPVLRPIRMKHPTKVDRGAMKRFAFYFSHFRFLFLVHKLKTRERERERERVRCVRHFRTISSIKPFSPLFF